MNVPNLLAGGALAGIGLGVGWWLHPGAGLVVVCVVVFAALSWTHLKGPPGSKGDA